MRRSSGRFDLRALALFCVIAAWQAWPLPRHLGTHLTGNAGGDTGVYVWNTWVFGWELGHGRNPLVTETILPLAGPTDLSLHNYTIFADLVSFVIQPLTGVVEAFNLVYLLNVALAGWAVYLLARRVSGAVTESLLAGLLFACSPFMVARSTAHFSLVAAAPLAFFLLWFDRAWHTRAPRDAALAGVAVAWAGYSDPYYAIYCGLLGLLVSLDRCLDLGVTRRAAEGARRVRRGLDAAALLVAAFAASVVVTGGSTVDVGSISVSFRSLFTPMLVLSAILAARALATWHVRVRSTAPDVVWRVVRFGAMTGVAAALLLVPIFAGLARRAADGQYVTPPVFWRSSAQGVDALSLIAPNPGHPLVPDAVRSWLSRQPNGYEDQVASLSFVAVAVVVLAWRYAGFRAGRLWLWITFGSLWLALGPFVVVGGQVTGIPTPWAFLRYVPIIGAARMPGRLVVLATLGLAVLFGLALSSLVKTFPRSRRALLTGVGLALVFELWPAPRTLYPAAIPEFFRTVATDPRPVRVLTLPFGMRDGLSSYGDYSARSQFHQTAHRKGLIGGYLSRVSRREVDAHLQQPLLDALVALSEGRTLEPEEEARARRSASRFVRRLDVGYVVVERSRMSAALWTFAADALDLELVATSGDYELYVPRRPARLDSTDDAPPGV